MTIKYLYWPEAVGPFGEFLSPSTHIERPEANIRKPSTATDMLTRFFISYPFTTSNSIIGNVLMKAKYSRTAIQNVPSIIDTSVKVGM